jgi:hypothetical protein
MSNENGVDMLSMILFVKCGDRPTLTMPVVLVRPQENFLAISKSGNITLKSLVAWSLERKSRLCVATNVAHLVSGSITFSLVAYSEE